MMKQTTVMAIANQLGWSVAVHKSRMTGRYFAALRNCNGHVMIGHFGTCATKRLAVAELNRKLVDFSKAVLKADGWELSE